MSPQGDVREEGVGSARTTGRRRQEPRRGKDLRKPSTCEEIKAESFRFDDPYWDEAFNSYYDPALRTCCRT